MAYIAIFFNVVGALLTFMSVAINYNDDYFRAVIYAFLCAANIVCLVYNIRGLTV